MLRSGTSLEEVLKQAVELEGKAVEFYEEMRTKSVALLATIPGIFKRVARKRKAHSETLASMRVG